MDDLSGRSGDGEEGPSVLSSAISSASSPQLLMRLAAELAEMHELILGNHIHGLKRRHPHHPGIRRMDALRDIADGKLFSGTRDALEPLASEIGLAMIESLWAPPRECWAHFWEAAIPDANTRQSVITRLGNPTQYEPTLSQLYFARVLTAEDLKTNFIEEHGNADLLLDPRNGAKSVPAEVKVVNADSSSSRVRKHIGKASKQIQNTGGPDIAGPLYLLVRRSRHESAELGVAPDDVHERVLVAEAAMHSSDFRSVSEVVVCWDDVRIVDNNTRVSAAITRQHIRLPHAQPRSRADLPASYLDVDSTVVLALGSTRDSP